MKTKEKVDRLAVLKAKLAELTIEAENIIADLKEKGVGIRRGTLVEANVWQGGRSVVDWEAVVVAARVPQRVIKKYTTTKNFLVLTLTARKVRRTKSGT